MNLKTQRISSNKVLKRSVYLQWDKNQIRHTSLTHLFIKQQLEEERLRLELEAAETARLAEEERLRLEAEAE